MIVSDYYYFKEKSFKVKSIFVKHYKYWNVQCPYYCGARDIHAL